MVGGGVMLLQSNVFPSWNVLNYPVSKGRGVVRVWVESRVTCQFDFFSLNFEEKNSAGILLWVEQSHLLKIYVGLDRCWDVRERRHVS